MKKGKTRRATAVRRHRRVRRRVRGTPEQPRLAVFRSLRHIYAQVIDDTSGRTLAAASDLEADLRSQRDGKNRVQVAEMVGDAIARKALEKGVKAVVFDRGGYRYHGRVKALAEAARKGRLSF